MKMIFATNNIHKLNELKNLLNKSSIELLSLNDFPKISEIKETGKSFEANALIKAKAIYKRFKLPVIADDSGLEVEALNNRPGIYSKRYAGPNATDSQRITKLLKELKNIPSYKRNAKFICAMVLYNKNSIFSVNGLCHGTINKKPKGKNGFGYDPVFFLSDLNKTMAQLNLAEKNVISHRANALKKIKDIIIKNYEL